MMMHSATEDYLCTHTHTQTGGPRYGLQRKKAAAVDSGRGASAKRRSPTPVGVGGGGATPPGKCGGTPAGGRRGMTPPLPAGAGRRSTPPLGAAAAGSKRKREAAGAGDTPPRRSAPTPPAPSVTDAAADAAAAAAPPGPAGPWVWSPEQLDAGGVPTVEGLITALRAMGPIPTDRLHLLQDRLDMGSLGHDARALLKSRVMQVARAALIGGRKYMVLK